MYIDWYFLVGGIVIILMLINSNNKNIKITNETLSLYRDEKEITSSLSNRYDSAYSDYKDELERNNELTKNIERLEQEVLTMVLEKSKNAKIYSEIKKLCDEKEKKLNELAKQTIQETSNIFYRKSDINGKVEPVFLFKKK